MSVSPNHKRRKVFKLNSRYDWNNKKPQTRRWMKRYLNKAARKAAKLEISK